MSNDSLTSNDTPDSVNENVDKIRDILFGKNMRVYEQKFSQLEQSFKAEIEHMQKSFEQKLQSVDNLYAEKVKSLQQRLNELDEANADSTNKLDNKLGDLETLVQSDMHGQKQDLLSHIDDIRKTLLEQLNSNRDMLQQEKMGKQELSNLFAEFALKANDDFDDESSS